MKLSKSQRLKINKLRKRDAKKNGVIPYMGEQIYLFRPNIKRERKLNADY